MDPDISREYVGDLIRSSRIRKGMTQRQLADLSTVSARAIRDLESGRTYRPRPHTVALLLSALGLRSTRSGASARSRSDEQPDLAEERGVLGYEPPKPLAPMVGRDDEVLALCDILAGGDHRVVVVTGLLGVGKTQLAAAAADLLRTAGDLRVVWIPLQAEPTTARGHGRRRRGRSTIVSSLVSDNGALADDEPALVAFDGCRSDPEHTARITAVLHRYPRLRVLATARTPLGIPGEQVLPLTPLPVPDLKASGELEALGRNPTVQVLVRSVSRLQPTFALARGNADAVTELCRRLDGIPMLLDRIASLFLLFGPEALLDVLSADLAGLMTDIAPEFVRAVRSTLSVLDPTESALLTQLVRLPATWSVDEVAELYGYSRMTSARRVGRLRELGLVRMASAAPQVRFQVPEVVRALDSAGPSPTSEPQ